jgi:hypothetical protein
MLAYGTYCFLFTVYLTAAHSAFLTTSGDHRLKSPWFCHDLDCPAFTVEDEKVATDVELRNYPAGVIIPEYV